MENDYLLIIDGSSLLSTQFYGNLPREILFAKTIEEKERYFHKIMMTRTGVYTNAVFGFLRVLFKILKEQKPSYLAVTWDLTRDTFRRELYPEYKGNRQETMKPLADQFGLCQEVLKRMGVAQFMDEAYEADDFSGSIARRFEEKLPVRILTRDHDYLQLVNGRTHLWLMLSSEEKAQEFRKKYGISDNFAPEKTIELDERLVELEFQVKPCHVNSLKGLQGDSSDNIPGVPGIGPQTAVKLISRYGTVDAIYDALKEITPEKESEIKKEWKEKLGLSRSPLPFLLKTSDTELVGEAAARLSEKLATIRCDIDLGDTTLEHLKININLTETEQLLNELEFRSLTPDFSEGSTDPKIPLQYRFSEDLTEFLEYMSGIPEGTRLGLSLRRGEGIAFSNEAGEGVYFKEGLFLTQDFISREVVLASKKGVFFVSFHGKEVVKFCSIIPDDVSVMAYLIDPLSGSYEPEDLITAFFKERLSALEEGSEWKREIEEAFLALRLYQPLKEGLEEKNMDRLYFEIEKPTISALASLEETGILVEKKELRRFADGLRDKIASLENEIYELAGERFNINSPKQLGEVLFQNLKLPYGKKTKTGYSTSVEVLERLKDESPLVQKILDYRTYSKLLNTYADGLESFIRKDGRIYGKFHQTVTATGRISSSDPNLQNIPVRTELGRSMRKVFVPKPGCVFIDADYSQIELRVLAHLSGDETLIDAYNRSEDIHTLTASQVFHVPVSEVTPEMRRNAKAVNFGIIYGISAFSLAGDLSISRSEAEEYMRRYFETYPTVHAYLKKSVEDATRLGYSVTLFGRMRPIPELSSSNFNQRSFGERVAMNAPIQGTAADIMKIAVIRIDRTLKENQLKSRMVLQIHDEVLIEAYEEEADKVEELLVHEMEHATKLKVKLIVEAKRGYSWYETK